MIIHSLLSNWITTNFSFHKLSFKNVNTNFVNYHEAQILSDFKKITLTTYMLSEQIL